MTDRPYSCKDSPNGRHLIDARMGCCGYCHRTVSYLRDIGWNVPAHDPDWQDQEADVNDDRFCPTCQHRWGLYEDSCHCADGKCHNPDACTSRAHRLQ